MSEKTFEEWFEENFCIEHIADGDWSRVDFCGQEFGMRYTPDYEIEEFARISKCTWNHQQKKIDTLIADNKTLNECITQAEETVKDFEELEAKLSKAVEALRFYADGEIGNDLEVRPEKKDLWSIPDRWSQRSMSDHYAGKLARKTLEELEDKGDGL